MPWLTIIGIGEDGVNGLGAQALDAIESAEVIMGAARHLALLGQTHARQITWPVPFADGLSELARHAHRPTVVLASGDPFWHGAAAILTKSLRREEWRVLPNLSSLSLAAAELGWSLEKTVVLGLHAAPFETLRPYLQPHPKAPKLLITIRDGAAINALCKYLVEAGFGDSELYILSALGGERQKTCFVLAKAYRDDPAMVHPLMVGIVPRGALHDALPRASGLEDDCFEHDGQITKRPVRAMTLSALAPKAGERLLDIGGGSGSIAIEWLLCDPSCQAVVVEKDGKRAARIERNAARLGQHRLEVIKGAALDQIDHLPDCDAIFIGGGLSNALLEALQNRFAGRRIVVNAVTLESAALLSAWHKSHGGMLLRMEISAAEAIGPLRGWKAAYPIVQWSAVL